MLSSFRAFLLVSLSTGAMLLSSCEGQKPAATTAKPEAGPAAEVRYECPMGCAGSQSTKPGKCPVCEMELEKKS